MSEATVIADALSRIQQIVQRTLDGITPEQLAYRPHPEANSIAWLAWHLTRWQDTQVSNLTQSRQLWLDGWHAKFGKTANAEDTGVGDTAEQVAGLQATAEALAGYHNAVCERSVSWLRSAPEAEMTRMIHDARRNRDITVAERLVGVLSDNFQHAGQMAYLRGLPVS
jgi:hypothetical protein